MLSSIVQIASLLVLAQAADYSTYPTVVKTATINGFADKIYDRLPTCAQECVKTSTSSTPCPYWDPGCLCVISTFANSVANCFASSCSGSDVGSARSLATSICSSAGVPAPYWYIDSAASSSLDDAAAKAAAATTSPATTSAAATTPTSTSTSTSTSSTPTAAATSTKASSSAKAESTSAAVTKAASSTSAAASSAKASASTKASSSAAPSVSSVYTGAAAGAAIPAAAGLIAGLAMLI